MDYTTLFVNIFVGLILAFVLAIVAAAWAGVVALFRLALSVRRTSKTLAQRLAAPPKGNG